MSDVLVGLVVAAVLLPMGVWGRRNFESLVPPSLSAYGRVKRARELRRGATTLIVVAALLLIGVSARVVVLLAG